MSSALPNALVADANVLLAAAIGGRAAHVFWHPDTPRVFAATTVQDEVVRWLPRITQKRRLDLSVNLATFENLPVTWVETTLCGHYEEEARRRMASRDEVDWPTVALALSPSDTLEVAVWSQDKDFEASDLKVMTTGTLLDRLEGRF